MLSTSRDQLRWTVILAGRQYVVDVAWPGFANQISIDGHPVQRWRWPGNNLYTTRSFELGGVRCTIIRRRTGLVDFAFELRVDAPDAVVQQVQPQGAPTADPNHAAQGKIIFAVLVALVVLLVTTGIVIGIVAAR